MSTTRQHVALVYPVSPDGQSVLMQFHKDSEDPSFGRYNGLTAYLSPEESIAETARRALRIAGIQDATLVRRGVVHWSRYNGYDWPLVGHFFLAHPADEPVIIQETPEVRRQWVELDRLLAAEVPCWPGDAHIFPLLFDGDARPFDGLMVYHQGLPSAWRSERT